MLYWLAEYLDFAGFLNLFRYLTFRAGAAVTTALVIGMLIGPRFISMLRVRQGKGQPIRDDGPQTHLAKVGTPTMGGLMILTSLVIGMVVWMYLTNPFVWACLAVTIGFGAIANAAHGAGLVLGALLGLGAALLYSRPPEPEP